MIGFSAAAVYSGGRGDGAGRRSTVAAAATWARRLGDAALLPAGVAALMAALGLGAFDYHLALACAPASAVAAAWLAAAAARGERPALWRWLAVFIGPLAVAGLASPWQPACAWADPLALWVQGPVGAACWGLGVGCAAGLAGHRGWRAAALIGLLALAAVPAAWHFLATPQIFAYAPFVGRIAGALYEDAVAAEWRDFAYRLADLAWVLPVLAVAVAARQLGLPWSPRSLRLLWRAVPAVRWALAVAALALLGGWIRADAERWRIRPAQLLAALPRTLTAANGAVIVHGPRDPRFARPLQLAAADAAFRYRQLQRFFGHDCAPLHLYLWPDAGSKRAWTGAYRVEMAKPWLGQAHLVLPEFGSSTLLHEMAHVFAAQWAGNWLGVPLKGGLLPDALTIEGLAVAAEWPVRGGIDPHGWARAARMLGKAPPLQQLATPGGFLRLNADLGYTLAGSLLRFAGDRCGRAALQRAYRDGDLAAGCAMPMPELLKQWAAYVDDPQRNPLSDRDLQVARARFDPPGLFDRPCAMATGRCRDRAGRLHGGGNDGQAAGLWEAMRADLAAAGATAIDGGVAMETAAACQAAGRPRCRDGIGAWIAEQDRRPPRARANAVTLAAVRALDGDLAWQGGDFRQAEQQWLAAAAAPIDENFARTLEAKLALNQLPAAAPLLRHLLCAGGPYADARAVFARIEAADHPLLRWLAARFALRWRGDEPFAQQIDAQLPALQQGYPLAAREAVRTLALASARIGRCDRVQLLAPQLHPPALAAEIAERCAAAAQN